MRRTVPPAMGRTEPAGLASGDVIGDERAGGGHDGEGVDYQRRARAPPAWHFLACVGSHVPRPHAGTSPRVERVDDSGRTDRVDAAVVERRRSTRTGAAI